MRILKPVFQAVQVTDENDSVTWRVKRNYMNGKSIYIGREYKTPRGCINMVNHRNDLEREKHGTHWIKAEGMW